MHLPDDDVEFMLTARYRSGGTRYVGLSLTVPDDHVSPASVTEAVGASYQRVVLALDATSFAAAVARAIETIVDTVFPAPLEDQGVVLALVLFSTAMKGTGVPAGGAIRLAEGINIIAGGSPVRAPAGLIRFEAP